jgi:peptidoglycan/xylan/chitin deacetylase (PgdA/CDA1 family)
MRSPRHWLKEAVSLALTVVGSSGASGHAILIYHFVGGPLGVPPSMLERQITYLKDRFRVIRLDEFSDELARDDSRRIACLTFDDGYLDTHVHALPVLEKTGAKATFFLSSSFLGGRIRTRYGEMAVLTREHAEELIANGHEVGAHTVTHARLDHLPRSDAWHEIVGSKRSLEDHLGTEVTSFAYPKGRYNGEVLQMVSDAGFARAVTVEEAFVGSTPDWFQLPRIQIHGAMGQAQFRAKLSALETYMWLWRRTLNDRPSY